MNFTYKHNHLENLGDASCLLRIAVGAALIAYTMGSSVTPLGWLAILPLLAIYPIFTGITGLNPVRLCFTHKGFASYALHLNTVTRAVLGFVGVAAISSVYLVSGVLGYVALLPLLGIYPVFAAIIGQDPVTALYNMDQASDDVDTVEPDLTVVETNKVSAHHGDDYHRAA